MRCIKCNSDIPSNAKFCPKCGTKVEISERPVEFEKPTDVIFCSKCGASYPITAKFCKKDGTPLRKVYPPVLEIKKPEVTEKEIKPEAIVEPKLEAPMEVKTEEKPLEPEKPKDVIICPKCGTENLITAKFCKKDGTPLREEIKPPVTVEKKIKPEETVRPKIEVAPKVEIKKEAKKPSKTWIWIAVGGLVLIIAGVGSYLYFSGQIGKKPVEVTAVPEVPKIPEPPKLPEEVVEEIPPQKPETEVVSPPIPTRGPPKPTVDIARVERDLNMTLKNRGLGNVSAKVNKDMAATLKGTVDDPRDKMLASNIAESFREIKEVKNEILVAKRAPAPARPAEVPIPAPELEAPAPPPVYKIDPAKLEGDINRALRNAGLKSITAEVNDNLEVTLKGSVGSNYEKDRAFEIAKRFKEAKRIRDVIFVVEQ